MTYAEFVFLTALALLCVPVGCVALWQHFTDESDED